MEASPFHHDHHSFLLDKSLLYPNPITPVVTSINSSDEFHQPHDHIIPYGSTDVSCYSNQAGICQNLQSSDSPMPMVVHGHIYDKTMPSTDSYVMTNKTCKSSRSQNKSNIGQENNNKKMKDSKEGQNGYVYVRARRGEATDNHSLAERVRREKISEKMKALQAIVPGCNKITGKALMLEEVINYVQFLQNEIQLLSSKLACVSPTMNDYEAEFDASKPLQNMITNQQQLLSFQEHQMSNMGFQSNGEVVWDLQEQRQELEDPFAIINNFINSF